MGVVWIMQNELDIYILVREYLKKTNPRCITHVGVCEDCGMCWMTPEEKNYVLSMMKFNAQRSFSTKTASPDDQ